RACAPAVAARPARAVVSREVPVPSACRSSASSSFACLLLVSGEYRIALLHEGGAAFRVVGALEAAADERGAQVQVLVRRRLQDFAGDGLAGRDRERGVARERGGVLRQHRLEAL